MPFDHASAPETEDPRETLKAKSIHKRCAAARDLSRYGGPDDLPLLIARAQADKSPAVRLGTAGAAADILSRYRVGDRRSELSDDLRASYFELFKGMDPAVNGGLFSLLACIGLPVGFRRITSGLRDPRGDVRLGAAIGLLRLCESSVAHGDEELEAAVVDILRDPRLKPDAVAEVAWVAARVGYRSARDAISVLALTGTHAELVEKALGLLRSYDEPLRGAFFTDGRDAGAVDPNPQLPEGFALFSGAGALMGDGSDASDWSYLDGVLPGGIRRMFIRRVGDAEPGPAFQLGGRTWYQADEERLLNAAMAVARPDSIVWSSLEAGSPLDAQAAGIFGEFLTDDADGDLLRALLVARGGSLDDAVAAFDACYAHKKKIPKDAGFYAGQAWLAAGRATDGKAALKDFLKKAKKKDPRREAAEALLA